jgi:hypothetical protein
MPPAALEPGRYSQSPDGCYSRLTPLLQSLLQLPDAGLLEPLGIAATAA